MLSLNGIIIGSRKLEWQGRQREDGTTTTPGWKALVDVIGPGGTSGSLSVNSEQVLKLSDEQRALLELPGSRIQVDLVRNGAYINKNRNAVATLEAAEGATIRLLAGADLFSGEAAKNGR